MAVHLINSEQIGFSEQLCDDPKHSLMPSMTVLLDYDTGSLDNKAKHYSPIQAEASVGTGDAIAPPIFGSTDYRRPEWK